VNSQKKIVSNHEIHQPKIPLLTEHIKQSNAMKDKSLHHHPWVNQLHKLYDADNTRHATFVREAALGNLETVEAMLQGDDPLAVDYHPAYSDTAL